MLCHDLSRLIHSDCEGIVYYAFRPGGLLRGSAFVEPSRSTASWHQTRWYFEGKDASINHMIAGGNGYPVLDYGGSYEDAVADAGATCERRDLKANLVWERDYLQCEADRKRGRMDG